MECTKDNIYFLIESARRNNMNATETFNFVNNAWPDHCPSLRHVRRLCKEFREETRENFEQKPGQGRPQSGARRNSLTTVEELIKADGSLTIDGISDMVGIPHSVVQRIVQEDLDVVWYKTK